MPPSTFTNTSRSPTQIIRSCPCRTFSARPIWAGRKGRISNFISGSGSSRSSRISTASRCGSPIRRCNREIDRSWVSRKDMLAGRRVCYYLPNEPLENRPQFGRKAMSIFTDTTGWQTKALWTGVAVLGAGSFAMAAINGVEAVNAAWLVVAAVCFSFIASRFYGLFVASRALGVDGARLTPAVRHNDGLDYVPTNRYVLYGHHFAAIA